MKRPLLLSIALCLALVSSIPSVAASAEFSFGVINHPDKDSTDDAAFRQAIDETNADNLAFVVTQGIKPAAASCSDQVYLQRKTLLESAQNGVVISLAAQDWATCPVESSKLSAVGRLTKLRDLLFFDEFSLGGTKIPVIRQSTIAKFRNFPENARWQFGGVMFATVNLPSNNNNYVFDAGRNSEFEDRLVANRDWLNRVFTFAQREKVIGIVLFSDGNPLASSRASGSQRDGFAETRKLLVSSAGKFPGKVLVVSRQSKAGTSEAAIAWRGNLGELKSKGKWAKIKVDRSRPELFILEGRAPLSTEINR